MNPRKKAVRFSEAQKASLNGYYGKGMNGTGKSVNHLICKAAKDIHSSINCSSQGMGIDFVTNIHIGYC